MKIDIFLEHFSLSRLGKVIVKLWGGVSSILFKGQASVYPFINFFIDYIDFLSILLIF